MFCFLIAPLDLSAQATPTNAEETPVAVYRPSGIEVKGSTEFCEGGATTLWIDGDYKSFSWSNGSSERSIIVEKPGVYEVTVVTKGGCSFTTSVNVRTRPCT
jgi:hypothetical protein